MEKFVLTFPVRILLNSVKICLNDPDVIKGAQHLSKLADLSVADLKAVSGQADPALDG